MASKELIDYIKQTLSQGFPEEQIRKELLGAGWLLGDINEAFGSVKSPTQTQPPSQIRSPQTSVYPSNQPIQVNKSQPTASPISDTKRDPLSSPFLSTPSTNQPVNQFSNTAFNTPKKSKLGLIIAIIAVVLILGGGVAYAYTQKLWFFAPSVSDEQLVGKLFENIKGISSASYNLSLLLETATRDPNIQPVSSTPEIDSSLSNLGTDSKFSFKISGDSQKQTSTENHFKINADVKITDGLSFAGEAEFLNKNSSTYLKLNQLPPLPIPGFDLGKITNKWIKIDNESFADLAGFPPTAILPAANLDSNANSGNQVSESLKSFFDLTQKQSLLVFGKSVKEKNGDADTYHYKLTIDKTKIIPFYQELGKEINAKFGDSSPFKIDEQFLAAFQGPDFDKSFDYLSKNSSFDLWVDPITALPQKLSFVFKIAPDSSVTDLKDKQVVISANLELSNINQPVTITEPTEFLSSDDLALALSGLTKEQYQIEKQTNNIEELRATLARFRKLAGIYPDSLDKLTITGDDILILNPKSTLLKPNKASSTDYCDYFIGTGGTYYDEFMPSSYSPSPTCGNLKFTKSVPQDAYTKTPYTYTKVGDDYKLTYTITFPAVSTSTATSTDNTAEFNLRLKKYKNGTNTATKLWLSQEAKSK
ncbi:MAG: hypothetical protein WCX12_02750 [Candidatus Paceibacterota bacterium]|jgi:hypothetical protein